MVAHTDQRSHSGCTATRSGLQPSLRVAHTDQRSPKKKSTKPVRLLLKETNEVLLYQTDESHKLGFLKKNRHSNKPQVSNPKIRVSHSQIYTASSEQNHSGSRDPSTERRKKP
ncbi:hypothetical protein HanIR_Chr15g0744081 [Helianthus annuus]|nr:hypothetical protein HanIR_Chr15g0744081 [Helianthus annuus]